MTARKGGWGRAQRAPSNVRWGLGKASTPAIQYLSSALHRLDVHDRVHDVMLGVLQGVFHAVGDFVTVVYRHVAVHFDMNVDPQPQAAFANAAHIDSRDAVDV